MKRAMSVFGVLIFFGIVVFGFYSVSKSKIITRSTEWAFGKLPPIEEGEYNVIVVGSDPEGVAAAIGAARSGAKTLLLGKEDAPGGLLTYGMLNTLDMNRDGDILLNRGVFYEFYNAIGHTESFDVEKAKQIFKEMIDREKRIEYRPNQTFIAPILEGNVILGVTMQDKDGNTYSVKGRRIIDATPDGDVCAAAGVPYTVGMEDINIKGNMAATLVLKVGGVKWSDIEKDLNAYKSETGDNDCGFNRSTAWGFGKWCYDKYTPIYKNMQLRGPNFGLQEDGTILINALQIFDVDGLNEESKKNAIAQGKEEAENVIKHLKEKLPSFKNAELVGTADELYIRETRHILGEYTLLATDVLGNRNFSDKIALASYPIDIQATSKSNTGYVIGSPKQYSIPLGCAIPKKIDNLFIVSRAASYSSVAAGSARVVPTGMTVGESSGIAAVYTIWKKITPRELLLDRGKIKQFSGILKNQNIYLNENNYKDPNIKVEGYDKIKKLINLGMLSGGYTNNFFFDNTATISTLCNAMVNSLQRGGNEKYNSTSARTITKHYSTDRLTGGIASRILVEFFGDYPNIGDKYIELSIPNANDNVAKTQEINEVKKKLDEEKNAELGSVIDDDRKEINIKRIEKSYESKTEKEVSQIEDKYKEKRRERLKPLEEECFKIAKEKGYFSEEFGIDEVLTCRQVYVIAVDAIERYIGRELVIATE